jgi:hypothetical protein
MMRIQLDKQVFTPNTELDSFADLNEDSQSQPGTISSLC